MHWVRDPAKVSLQHPNLQLIKGDPAHEADILQAMEGCEAVISSLNISRRSDFPWAALRTPMNFLSDTIQRVINAMAAHKIRRIIVISAWGVRETASDIPAWFRFLIKNSNIGAAYTDHEKQEIILERQNLDWNHHPAGRADKYQEDQQNAYQHRQSTQTHYADWQSAGGFLYPRYSGKKLHIGALLTISQD